jgi:hypothetical protein
MSGSGLRPPGESSVAPRGIPALPPADCAPRPVGEEAEAVGLEEAAVAPLTQVPEAFPERPAASNKGVGAGVPPIMAPPDVIGFIAVEVPMPEVPGMEVEGCADAPMPEHAAAALIEPSGDVPATDELMPGVASSVAPSGIPVAPTGAPGPMPSGEVTPSVEGAPVIMPTWAKAGLKHSKGQATAAIHIRFMEDSPV